jgi:hypothetical protein
MLGFIMLALLTTAHAGSMPTHEPPRIDPNFSKWMRLSAQSLGVEWSDTAAQFINSPEEANPTTARLLDQRFSDLALRGVPRANPQLISFNFMRVVQRAQTIEPGSDAALDFAARLGTLSQVLLYHVSDNDRLMPIRTAARQAAMLLHGKKKNYLNVRLDLIVQSLVDERRVRP